MTFYFHPDAETEFNDAIDHYEEKQNDLGLDFALEVYMTIDRILSFPKAWPIVEGKRSLPPGSADVSSAEIAAKMASLPG